jgi:antitoxin component of MazEF toxin-antitoxin module
MIKTITKLGDSQGILFDSALMELAHLKVGDQVNLEIHHGRTLTLTPLRTEPDAQEVSRVIKATMKDYQRTMRRLA